MVMPTNTVKIFTRDRQKYNTVWCFKHAIGTNWTAFRKCCSLRCEFVCIRSFFLSVSWHELNWHCVHSKNKRFMLLRKVRILIETLCDNHQFIYNSLLFRLKIGTFYFIDNRNTLLCIFVLKFIGNWALCWVFMWNECGYGLSWMKNKISMKWK